MCVDRRVQASWRSVADLPRAVVSPRPHGGSCAVERTAGFVAQSYNGGSRERLCIHDQNGLENPLHIKTPAARGASQGRC